MTEIELKARVQDRDALIKKLNSLADFKGHIIRNDEYFGLKNSDGVFLKNKIRIRKESCDGSEKILLTYKHKEEHIKDKNLMEVNDEKECIISDDAALKTFLKDFGFELSLKKHKDVLLWTYEEASLELCSVPPLGDFLEIEILSPEDSPKIREAARKKLEEILSLCGIPEDRIENRYYSDMLREAAAEDSKA
ncbi:MAG: class IV adenylate cyclase [Treponema sp.]|nr:class IV adenylate cyclase [Treponema sp.]